MRQQQPFPRGTQSSNLTNQGLSLTGTPVQQTPVGTNPFQVPVIPGFQEQQVAPNPLPVSTASGIPLQASNVSGTPLPVSTGSTAPSSPACYCLRNSSASLHCFNSSSVSSPVSTAPRTSTASAPPQHQVPGSADKPPESNGQVIGEASSLPNTGIVEPEMEEPLPQRIIPASLPVPPPNFIHTDTGTKV